MQSSTAPATDQHPVVGSSKRLTMFQGKRQKWLIAGVVAAFGLIGLTTAIWARAATTTYQLWPNNPTPRTVTVNIKGSIELGLKFKAKSAGYVTGVRFYKGAQNTGTHTGSLWDNQGHLLATTTFKNETASGWQTATFPQPISVAANVNYVISYHAPVGYYSSSARYFKDAAYRSGPLTAPRSGNVNGNGVYASGSSTLFPNQSNDASNYWVDVDFTAKTVNPPTAPAAPLGVSATQNTDSIVLTWQASQSANSLSQYRIYRGGSQLATVSGSTLTYIDKAVTAGQTYAYQIQAIDNTNATSALSNTVTITYNVVPPTTPTPPTTGGAMSIRISGKDFVDQNNKVIRLVGVNRSGTQYACMDGDGFSDGPIDDASIDTMKSWGINVVRVNMNEQCWLGINGVAAAYGSSNYQKAIGDFVKRLHNHGMYVIIDMHHSNSGTKKATDTIVMADRDHAVDYWKSVGAYFKDDHAVIFDLFNEPYPDNNRNTTAAWTCVRDGGTCPGVTFTAAGMQEMLNAVRSAGATQPVMISGPQYAGVLDRWTEFKPADPQNQLAASVHIYGQPLGSPYDDTTLWDKDIAPLASKVPIVVGELGDSDCSHKFIDKFMPWADTHGLSYVAWAWVTSDCAGEPALISNYNGTPTAFGLGFRDHVKALGLQ